jgi:hypothetical protein
MAQCASTVFARRKMMRSETTKQRHSIRYRAGGAFSVPSESPLKVVVIVIIPNYAAGCSGKDQGRGGCRRARANRLPKRGGSGAGVSVGAGRIREEMKRAAEGLALCRIMISIDKNNNLSLLSQKD